MNGTLNLGSAFSAVQDQGLQMIQEVLPYGIAVGVAVLAIGIGWKIVKRLTGR